jgi:anti-sigma factor RsiW
MSHDRYAALLNDYVDGHLEPPQQAEMEAHLAGCQECAREAAGLRSLLAEAGRLPRSIEPSGDLWPGVAGRLDAGDRRRGRFLRPRYAVAAVALLAVAFSLTQVRTKKARERTAPPVAVQPVATGLVSLAEQWRRTEMTYERAAAELQAALDAVREELEPATVARIETNLAIIDDAIRESRAALDADPNNLEVLQLLAAVHEKKLDLLQQAARYQRL